MQTFRPAKYENLFKRFRFQSSPRAAFSHHANTIKNSTLPPAGLMQRKIIQLGDETLVVSLPSGWARQHHLKKGDFIDAEEQGQQLIVYPAVGKHSGQVNIDVSGARPMVKRLLGALYKVGYDEFEVRFSTAEEKAAIKDVLSEFVGFELVEEFPKRVIIKNVSTIVPQEFGNLQRKLLSLLLTVADESLTAAQAKSWGEFDQLRSMDADVNRAADFCRRILNTAGYRVVRRVAPSYYIIEQLERIGDGYRDLCQFIGIHHTKLSKGVIALYLGVNELLRAFSKLQASFGIADVTLFAKQHYELKGQFDVLLPKAAGEELPILMLLKTIEGDLFDLNGALLAEKL